MVKIFGLRLVGNEPQAVLPSRSDDVFQWFNHAVFAALSSAPRCELTESLVVWVRIRFSPVRSPTYLQQLRIGLGLSSGSPGFEARSLKRAKNPRLRPQSASPILLPSEPRLNSAETRSTQHSTHLKFKRQSETRSRSPIR